ncbi:hypothetical protein MHYP_G00214920 [Metynnis hypsauchen]
MDPQQVPGLESIIVQISLQTAFPGGETRQRERDRGEASDGRAPDRGRMLETPCRMPPRALASTENAFLYIDADLHTSVASALAQAVLSWETQVGLWKLMEGRRDRGTDGRQQQMGLGIPLAACQQPGQLPRSVLQRPGPVPQEPPPTSGSSLSSGARAGPLQQLIHDQADSGYCIG